MTIDCLAITTSIQRYLAGAETALQKAQSALNETSANHFVEKKLGVLLALIDLYRDLYQSLKVADRESLENQWTTLLKVAAVQDAVNDLLDFEDSWNKFLQNIDQQVALGILHGPTLNVGDRLPDNLTSDLASHKCSVVLVSFGVLEGAKRWLQETGFTFPLYVDGARKIYSAFNLPRSVAKVYDWLSLSYYGAAKARGEDIPRMFENIEDDPQQLGGDFIVTNKGGNAILSFIHRSATASDRPAVKDILSFLENFKA